MKLYTVPEVSVGNIVTTFEVGTDLINSAVLYDITVKDMRTIRDPVINATVVLKDAEGNVVKSVLGLSGRISLSNQHLWWPVGMNTTVGYLHTLMVMLSNVGSPVDVYRLPIGIRTVEVSGTTFLINHKPFYFHGFGRHEDWNIRGKGMDWSMIVKDFNMIDWLGANSFRTSHYPYSEEIMQMCDERGIVVIDECPAVGMKSPATFVNKTLQHHLEVMSELVSRDMNHPSVVMWSIANEPASNLHESEPYFKVMEITQWFPRITIYVLLVLSDFGLQHILTLKSMITIQKQYIFFIEIIFSTFHSDLYFHFMPLTGNGKIRTRVQVEFRNQKFVKSYLESNDAKLPKIYVSFSFILTSDCA